MSVRREDLITQKKLFQGDALNYNLSESQEVTWHEKYKKTPQKVVQEIAINVQKNARMFLTTLTKGNVWEQDCKDITDAVVKVISQ